MGQTSDDPRKDAAEDIARDVHEGVLVVIVPKRGGKVLSDVIDIMDDWVTDTDFEPPLHALVDVRKAEFAPSAHEVRVGARRLERFGDSARIALVVADDFQFGLGRMLGILSESSGVDLRPFVELEEAARWVRKA